MGAIIAKFRRKRSTYEILEHLEDRIKDIEEYKSNTELQRKKIVGHLILFSVGVYVITAVLFYFFFFPATLYDQLFYLIPLLGFPIIIAFVKRLLTWHYNRKLRTNQLKLAEMKNEKRKILEKVMDTETYKVAKDILEKFAPEQLRKSPNSLQNLDLTVASSKKSSPSNLSLALKTPDIKQRFPSLSATPHFTTMKQSSGTQSLLSSTQTPMPYNMSMASKTPNISAISSRQFDNFHVSTPAVKQQISSGGGALQPNLPMPRTILARERSVMDKMVEYLIGDGPNNRFALICNNCHSHNGMALREEFEYISFRCCYCYTYNPARKLRAAAPKLEDLSRTNSVVTQADGSTSESEKNSPSDTDSDTENTSGNKLLQPLSHTTTTEQLSSTDDEKTNILEVESKQSDEKKND